MLRKRDFLKELLSSKHRRKLSCGLPFVCANNLMKGVLALCFFRQDVHEHSLIFLEKLSLSIEQKRQHSIAIEVLRMRLTAG